MGIGKGCLASRNTLHYITLHNTISAGAAGRRTVVQRGECSILPFSSASTRYSNGVNNCTGQGEVGPTVDSL